MLADFPFIWYDGYKQETKSSKIVSKMKKKELEMKKVSKRIVSLVLALVLVAGSTLVVNAKTARFTYQGYTASCKASSTSTSVWSRISTSPTSPWGVATVVYAMNSRGEPITSVSNTSTGGSCTATRSNLSGVSYADAEYYMSSSYANYLGRIVE